MESTAFAQSTKGNSLDITQFISIKNKNVYSLHVLKHKIHAIYRAKAWTYTKILQVCSENKLTLGETKL